MSAHIRSEKERVPRERATLHSLDREGLSRVVWETAVDAMALSDADGIVLMANPAYLELYGYGADDVIGHSFAIIFPEEQREWAEAEYRRYFAGGEPSPAVEAVIRRANGQERIVDTRYSFLEEDGERTAMLSVIRDVTETVQARREEQEALRQKDDFLLNVSHDLKTPVAGILGHAQLLLRSMRRSGSVDMERHERGLRMIESTAIRMNRLIEELVDAASIQMGHRLGLRPARIDLVDLALQVVARLEAQVRTHRLVIDAPDHPVVGIWDGIRLERVLDNLLSNAIKYSPDGGTIVVSVVMEGPDWAVLTVSDEGIGIAETDLERIFDRFFRAEISRQGVGGAGIGLAGVRQIVEQHGGAVSASSVEGEGSTFTVRLPMKSGAREETPAP